MAFVNGDHQPDDVRRRCKRQRLQERMPDHRSGVFGDEIDATTSMVEVDDLLSNSIVVDFVGPRSELPRSHRDRTFGCCEQHGVLPPCFSDRGRV
jgi:hypothetical protein